MTRKICRLSPLFLCDFKLSKFFFFTFTLSPLVLKSSTSISTHRQLESVSSSVVLTNLEPTNAGNDRAVINHSSKERLEICLEDLVTGRFKQHSASESFVRKSSESIKHVRSLPAYSVRNVKWDDLVEFEKRELVILFAQEEAKCLEEFGELKPAPTYDFLGNFSRPVVCLAGSINYKKCEQCTLIIRRGLNATTNSQCINCQNICHGLSALADCADRCSKFLGKVVTGMESSRKRSNIERKRCNGKNCESTTSPVNIQTDSTGGKRKQSNTLTTKVFCEGVTHFSSVRQTASNSLLTTSPHRHSKDSNYPHFVYLKSVYRASKNETNVETKVPIVFVIEQRELLANVSGLIDEKQEQWTDWKALGKSYHGLDKIQVAYQQQTYEWRVTAVGVNGPLADSVVNSFKTLDGYVEPGPPGRVFVVQNKPKEATVDVLLGWDPPQERACFYKIVLEDRSEDDSIRTVRIKGEPSGVHGVLFQDLKFDSSYEVRITSRSADWHEDESTHASLSFTTPACLEAHQFRFDKCAPPSPQNVSYIVKSVGSSKLLDLAGNPAVSLKRYFSAHLSWQPPPHASTTNLITEYTVDIRTFSWNNVNSYGEHKHKSVRSEAMELDHKLSDSQNLFAPLRINLPGNVTDVTLENLHANAEYTVLVYAISSKGSSQAATLTLKFNTEAALLEGTIGLWVYPCAVLIAVMVITSTCHAVKTISRRRQIKAARDLYFKSIDQRDAFAEDWSVVSLTEDPNNTWKVLEENSFPKDKWHVGFQDLKIGDIIGQGAFGIVRQAKIRSDKYLELLKRHNRRTLETKYRNCSTKLSEDETEMETVALKMLRVAATEADRDDLMKELMTMQSLGTHPQIVTLLGVCTTPKSMYLVLEYCPGGDLLSFLRKFREHYLPMLNIECGSRSGSRERLPFSHLEYNSLSHEDRLKEKSLRRDGGDCEQVCYTDLDPKGIPFSSRELLDESHAVAKEETETDVPMSNNVDETCVCESISEKDVLSYARQIALGMAYLERNHIIHRDLACRNILVMGDHKRVKISDFGLSRDIYTWNVYEQKTAAKLPFKWMALESITSRVFTSKSDVWSYGISLWELVTLGAVPYPALENHELFNVLRTGYRMERPDNCSEELYALMRKCWRAAPVDRPNFTELISYLETMMETEPELYLTLQP